MVRSVAITSFAVSLLLWSAQAFGDSLQEFPGEVLEMDDASCTSECLSLHNHSCPMNNHPHLAGQPCPIAGHRHIIGQPCPKLGLGNGLLHGIGGGLGGKMLGGKIKPADPTLPAPSVRPPCLEPMNPYYPVGMPPYPAGTMQYQFPADMQQPQTMGMQQPPTMGMQQPPTMGMQQPPTMGMQQPPMMGMQQPQMMGMQQPMFAEQPPVGLFGGALMTRRYQQQMQQPVGYAQGYQGYPPPPEQRIVYIPYAAPPPIYVERHGKGPPRPPIIRQILGDATMYEYPEMPLQLYTTRGPRDFMAPNPQSIGE